MSLIISSHRDVVRNDISLRIENGYYIGLLDNLIGNIVTYAILQHPSIIRLHKEGKVKFYFGEGEEFGLDIEDYKVNPKEDIVIAVDVCINTRYKNKDVGIEQTWGSKKIDNVIPILEWEGYKLYKAKYTADPNEADECDDWHKLKVPHLSFIIPIEDVKGGDNWHGECKISIEKVNKAILILTRLICNLKYD